SSFSVTSDPSDASVTATLGASAMRNSIGCLDRFSIVQSIDCSWKASRRVTSLSPQERRSGPSGRMSARDREPSQAGMFVPHGGAGLVGEELPAADGEAGDLSVAVDFDVIGRHHHAMRRGLLADLDHRPRQVIRAEGGGGQAGFVRQVRIGNAFPGVANGLGRGDGIAMDQNVVPINRRVGVAVLTIRAGQGEALYLSTPRRALDGQ